jgi:hypothetical protein
MTLRKMIHRDPDNPGTITLNLTKIGAVFSIVVVLCTFGQSFAILPYRMADTERRLVGLESTAKENRERLIVIEANTIAIKELFKSNLDAVSAAAASAASVAATAASVAAQAQRDAAAAAAAAAAARKP